MIDAKIRIPQSSLIYNYDKNHDILDVFIEKFCPVFSEEIYSGIYILYDRTTDFISGVTIMDYTKRDKCYINNFLPFSIDFTEVDKNAR